MIMQQTLFIVILAVVIALALAYRWKKKTEDKMGNDLNTLIEANDWCGVCRILRKQLIIWGVLLALCIALLIVRIVSNSQFYTPIIVCAILAWRFFKLIRLYRISFQNMKTIEQEKQEPQLMPIEEFLHGCKITHIDCKPDKIKQLWLDVYERGKANGFCPILLEIDDCFYDSLDEKSEWFDKAKFSVWKSSVLSSNPVDGQTFLCNRFEAVKEEWNDEEDWNVKVVGNDENLPPIDDFGISDDSHVYLVEVPVKEPWKVFAYIPMGEWNECPTAEEHMAVAKYWYEKYGAVVAHISNDMIQYYLPKPVTGDTMPLAEEHMGYCDDTIFQGENLTSLAAELKKSTVWCFWWD